MYKIKSADKTLYFIKDVDDWKKYKYWTKYQSGNGKWGRETILSKMLLKLLKMQSAPFVTKVERKCL